MTSTEIVPQEDLHRLVATGRITLSELLDKLAKAKPETEADAPKPKPKGVVLSPADKKTLRTLPAQLADLVLPESARLLTEAERAHLVPLFDQVKKASAAVKKAEDALKEAMHGHIDSLTSGGAVDKNGHKITEGEVVAPEYDKKVVRGLVGGKSVELTDSDLQEMEAEGLITHAQYLRMTKTVPSVRVAVPDAIMAEISKDGNLLAAFALKARKSDLGTAIRIAANV